MGGMIAQKMALIAKHRVRSLTLIATHGGGPTASPPSGTVRRFLRLQVSRDPEQRFRLFNEILFTAEFCAEHGARLRDGMAADLLHARQSRMGFTGQMGAVLTHRTGPILATLAGTPVMLMTGTHDACVRPVNTHMLATWMPWAQVRTYAGAGHGVNVQRYESVNRDLRAFLAG
jgi:pimeloyl-ACP methyl ester carboxylesterase